MTLLAALAIYARPARRVLLRGLVDWHKPTLYADALHVAEALTRVADRVVKLVTFGAATSAPSSPALWAAYLLGAAYLIRFSIYVSVFRRRLADANVTGSVIWSHITAFGLVVAFALIVAGWSAWVVVPAAGLALLAMATVLTGVLADAAEIVVSYLQLAWGALLAFAQEVARAAVAFAGLVKDALDHAQAWYMRHISDRVRRHSASVRRRSRDLRLAATARLEQQNRAHKEKFGSAGAEDGPEAEVEEDPPSDAPSVVP